MEVVPYWSTMTGGVTVAEEDMTGADTYFWEAPPEHFAGEKLSSYGLKLSARTSWHRGRGDTAGTLIRGPDLVLQVYVQSLRLAPLKQAFYADVEFLHTTSRDPV